MKYLLVLVAGLVLGIIGTVSYNNYSKQANLVELSGLVESDFSATYRYRYFEDKAYMQIPIISSKASRNAVYLNYDSYDSQQKILKGNAVIVGELGTIKIADNETVTEIKVISVKAKN